MQDSKKAFQIPASEIGDLKDFVERTFVTEKNGQETRVILVKAKRLVYLRYAKSERADGFTVSPEKFREYYCLLSSVPTLAPVV